MDKLNFKKIMEEEQEHILLNVCCVDENNQSNDEVILFSYPSATFAEVKLQAFNEWQFPMDIQLWIYRETVCSDNETLGERGLNNPNGNTVFLYLLSPEQQNIFAEKGHLDIFLRNFNDQKRPVIFPSTEQPLRKISPELGSRQWKCSQCTLMNEPDVEKCEACNTSFNKLSEAESGYN